MNIISYVVIEKDQSYVINVDISTKVIMMTNDGGADLREKKTTSILTVQNSIQNYVMTKGLQRGPAVRGLELLLQQDHQRLCLKMFPL